MEPVKIRNFYSARILEKIKKIKNLISNISYHSPVYGKLNLEEIPKKLEITPPNLWLGEKEKGKFFLKKKIPNNKNSKDPDFFYYHSFAWLTDLRIIGNENIRLHTRQVTKTWISNNKSWKSKTWDDYTLALRISNWLKNYDFFFKTSEENFREIFFKSISDQINHLIKNFSNIKRNSELITIIKTLIYVSICIPNKNSLYQIAIFNLKTELRKQILKDGCHFQRNPKIHLEVLVDLLDISSILNTSGRNVFQDLQSTIKRMSVVNHFFLHKDNSLALFNESSDTSVSNIKNIISNTPRPTKIPRELNSAGFQRINAKDTVVIVDCGVPIDYNSTYKAHSSAVGFELSYKKKRIIINTGAGFKGKINKTTAAHSTLTLNNTNAYKILNNNYLSRVPNSIKVKRIERYNSNFLEIENYSYKKQYDSTHKRLLYINKDGTDIRGEENIYCPSEIVFDIRFYLDSSIKTSLINNGKAIILKLPNGDGWKFISSQERINVISNKYTDFNKQPKINEHIHISGKTIELITVVRWSLKKY